LRQSLLGMFHNFFLAAMGICCGCHHSGVMVKKKINGIVKSCKEAVYHEQYSIEYSL